MKQTIENDDRQIEELEKELQKEERWENLTIQNSFLFTKVMSDEELCTELLRRIFPEMAIDGVHITEAEKMMKAGRDSRGIRLDVYAESGERIFDVEMQVQNTFVLPKRSRFYHATIDVTDLERGTEYDKLRDTYVIFICPFDMFGQGRHIYTFKMLCTEDPELEMEDGVVTMFLNAAGEAEDVSSEMKAFLDYVKGRPGAGAGDGFIEKIDEKVRAARMNREWRREYMMGSIYERDAYLRGEIKGLEKGREAGIQKMTEALRKLGYSEEEISKIVGESYDMVQEEVLEYIAGTQRR